MTCAVSMTGDALFLTALAAALLVVVGILTRNATRDADAIRQFETQLNRARGAYDFQQPSDEEIL